MSQTREARAGEPPPSKRVRILKTDDRIEIRFRQQPSTTWWAAIGATAATVVVLLRAVTALLAIEDPTEFRSTLYWLMPIVLAVLFVNYVVLVLLINERRISIEDGVLRSKSGPLPIGGTLLRHNVPDIMWFDNDVQSVQRLDPDYAVYVVTRPFGTHVFLRGLSEPEATFLTNELMFILKNTPGNALHEKDYDRFRVSMPGERLK